MATTSTNPATILEAVNILLTAVGQAEVMSLATADTNQESQKALQALSDVSVEVQQRGWHFNTEEDYPLNADPVTGQIAVPINTGSIVTGRRSFADVDLTQRGGFLYDKKARTMAIGPTAASAAADSSATFSTVYVDITFLFAYEDIPPPIRWYVVAYAGRRFGVGRVPDSGTYKFTKQVEDDALAEAETFDQNARGVGLPSTSSHFWKMRRR